MRAGGERVKIFSRRKIPAIKFYMRSTACTPTQMLSEASARTKAKKETADTMTGVTVIAPTIQRKSHAQCDRSCDSHVMLCMFLILQHLRSHWEQFLPTSPRFGYRTCFVRSALSQSFRPRTSGALHELSRSREGRTDLGSWFETPDLLCSPAWTREDQQRLVRSFLHTAQMVYS